jgi:fluoride ion exporter CrcB/FEX
VTTVLAYLLVAAGGAVGVLARFLLDRALAARMDPVLPWGTLVANLAGSGARGYALLNLGLTIPVGVGAAALGWLLAS